MSVTLRAVLAALALVSVACSGASRAPAASDDDLTPDLPDLEPARESAGTLKHRCDDGTLDACVELGRRHLVGDGIPRDRDQAVALWTRACDGGDGGGCAELGNLDLADEDDAKAVARGLGRLEKGCGMKSGYACFR